LSCVFILFFILVQCADPPKAIWPIQFDAQFGLFYPPLPPAPPVVNVSSHFYYNWDITSTLIAYPAGCIPIFAGAEVLPCNFIFNNVGTYFSSPAIPTCLMFPGVGSVPPAFLEHFNFSTATVSTDYRGFAHFVNFWVAESGFQYWTDVNTFADIQFLDGGSILWVWAGLHVVPQNTSMFTVPLTAPKCATVFPPDVLAKISVDKVPYASFSRFSSKWVN